MTFEIKADELRNIIYAYFEKKGIVLCGISFKEVICDGENSLKCSLCFKKNLCGVEKIFEKKIEFRELKALVDMILKESLEEGNKLKKITYNFACVRPKITGVACKTTYFDGVEVEVETLVDKIIDEVNENSPKNTGRK